MMIEFDADLFAHRGANSDLPENTMYAIERMVEKGVKGIEIDVRLTLDGRVVLLHDTNLKRVSGVDKDVRELTYEELKKINVGHYIFGEEKQVHPPMLAEVLKYCKEHNVWVAIELKNKTDMSVVDKVFDIVAEKQAEDFVGIYSFEKEMLSAYQEKNPSYPLHLNLKDAPDKYIPLALEKGWGLNPEASKLKKDFVDTCKKHGIDVHVWTVNCSRLLNLFRCWGVGVIITDELVGEKKS